MLKLLIIFIAVVAVACTDCTDKQESSSLEPPTMVRNADSAEAMKIRFTNLIRGYKVSVVWHPIMENDGAYGSAEITFEDVKTQCRHIFTTNRFWMSSKLLPEALKSTRDVRVLDSSEYSPGFVTKHTSFNINARGVRIEVAYPTDNQAEAPFYFEDVSFDGKDELIIVERGMGVRGENSYTAYDFSCEADDLFEGTRAVCYHERVHELYGSFDNYTERDSKAKTVTMMSPNSSASGAEVTYGFVQMLPDSLAYLLPCQSQHQGKMFVPIRIKQWDYGVKRSDGTTDELFEIQAPVIKYSRSK